MSKVAVALVLSTGMLVLSAGCGGGSSPSSGPGFHTSVAGNKPLDQLSTPEVKQLCEDALTYFMDPVQGLANQETECRAGGFAAAELASGTTDAEIQATCQDAYAMCKAADAGVLTLDGSDGGTPAQQCAMTDAPPAGCTATVSQYAACVNEVTTAFNLLFVPCNQLTSAMIAATLGDGGDPTDGLGSGASCQAYMAACPGLSGSPAMMSSALRAGR